MVIYLWFNLGRRRPCWQCCHARGGWIAAYSASSTVCHGKLCSRQSATHCCRAGCGFRSPTQAWECELARHWRPQNFISTTLCVCTSELESAIRWPSGRAGAKHEEKWLGEETCDSQGFFPQYSNEKTVAGFSKKCAEKKRMVSVDVVHWV